MPFQEVPGLILCAVILVLAGHTAWFVHRATRQLKGEIAAAAVVRETLDAEFPKHRPPTKPPAVQGRRPPLQLLQGGRGALLFEIARRVGSYRQAVSAMLIAAVAVATVVLVADPISRHAPGNVPRPAPGAAYADTPSESPTPPPVKAPEPVSVVPVKEPAKEEKPPALRREVSPDPEPTRAPTVKPKRTHRPEPTATPTPTPRRTLVPRKLPVPTIAPTTVCVPALDVQVCVTR